MAELTTPTSSCCVPEAQTFCEPPRNAGTSTASASCCCSATKKPDEPVAVADIRETVRARYAAAASAVAQDGPTSKFAGVSTVDATGAKVFGCALYDESAAEDATDNALAASLGSGVPTAIADLHDGEIVLDLGCGAGADVLITARRVGPTGNAIGLDMTDEMLDLARANAAEAGVQNVEFLKGYIADIPLPMGSVDVVISNCVINLSSDKSKILAEAQRLLRPGGRIAIYDVIADPDMDDATRADMQHWTGCIAGALTEDELRTALVNAGLVDIDIRRTHQVHEHASSAMVRARKPEAASA